MRCKRAMKGASVMSAISMVALVSKQELLRTTNDQNCEALRLHLTLADPNDSSAVVATKIAKSERSCFTKFWQLCKYRAATNFKSTRRFSHDSLPPIEDACLT